MMEAAEAQEVKSSYGRALLSATFLDDFYTVFLASSPEIKTMFAKTDFAKQKDLLREGISFLMMFATGSAVANLKLDRLAKSHSRSRLNIRPEMYRLWIDSLMKVVRKHDPKFTEDLDAKWRRVVQKGISHMKQGYDKAVA